MPVRLTVARTIRPRSSRSTIVAIANAATIVMAALNQSACQSDSAMRGSGTRMGAHSTHQAVLLDALGTLISFEPPAPRLRLALRERLGADVSQEAAEAAMQAEIAYYREHLHEGRDAASLADLRARCAAAMSPALGLDVPVGALLDALHFFAYPDAAPALRELRAAGLRTVVVSNWDHSLHERLHETGLAPLSTACWRRPRSAPPSPTAPSSRPRWSWRGRATRGTWGTPWRPTSRARGRRGCGRC